MKKVLTICVVAAVLAIGSAAQATMVINITEQGSDVVADMAGSVNLTDLTNDGTWPQYNTLISPGEGTLVTAGGDDMVGYYGMSGPSSSYPFWGTGSFELASSYSGNDFGIQQVYSGGFVPYIFVADDYVSGSQLNTTITFAGNTIAGLGLAEGTYEYTWGSGGNADSLSVNVVPEPATLCLLGLGGLFLRKRKHA